MALACFFFSPPLGTPHPPTHIQVLGVCPLGAGQEALVEAGWRPTSLLTHHSRACDFESCYALDSSLSFMHFVECKELI